MIKSKTRFSKKELYSFAAAGGIFIGGLVLMEVWMNKRQNYYKLVRGCGVVTSSFMARGDALYYAVETKPMITFFIEGEYCNYQASTAEWQMIHVGDRRSMVGKVKAGQCGVVKLDGPC